MLHRLQDTEPVCSNSLRLREMLICFYVSVQQNFVQVVRAMEIGLGIGSGFASNGIQPDSNQNANVTTRLNYLSSSGSLANSAVAQAIADAVPILLEVMIELGSQGILSGPFGGLKDRNALVTK